MRVECRQCGGLVALAGPDSLARCPWCGALARYSPGEDVFHQLPALGPEQVERLFPPGSVLPPRLMWFPYRLQGSRLSASFSQPYPSLDGYEPPSGDMRPWKGSEDAEEVPCEPGQGRLVYHPFYSVTERDGCDGFLVDGISGRIPGHDEGSGAGLSEGPLRVVLRAFAAGLVPSVLIYLAVNRVSPVLAVLLAAPAGYFTATALERRRRRT